MSLWKSIRDFFLGDPAPFCMPPPMLWTDLPLKKTALEAAMGEEFLQVTVTIGPGMVVEDALEYASHIKAEMEGAVTGKKVVVIPIMAGCAVNVELMRNDSRRLAGLHPASLFVRGTHG